MRLELANGHVIPLAIQPRKDSDIRDIILQRVTQAQEPTALATLSKGESLPFGDLELSKRGVTKGAQTLTWDKLDSVSVRKGILLIKQKNKRLDWAALHDTTIPNASLFLALVEALRRESQETQPNQASQ